MVVMLALAKGREIGVGKGGMVKTFLDANLFLYVCHGLVRCSISGTGIG